MSDDAGISRAACCSVRATDGYQLDADLMVRLPLATKPLSVGVTVLEAKRMVGYFSASRNHLGWQLYRCRDNYLTGHSQCFFDPFVYCRLLRCGKLDGFIVCFHFFLFFGNRSGCALVAQRNWDGVAVSKPTGTVTLRYSLIACFSTAFMSSLRSVWSRHQVPCGLTKLPTPPTPYRFATNTDTA